MSDLPHVVIIGGGFGGLSAAKALANAPVRVTLIDRTNHHLFQPLLYQVAMAGLSPADIATPIRSILSKQKNIRVLLAEATGVNLPERKVRLRDGELDYDYLILAAGARTSYFGQDQWAEYAAGLKDLDDALHIRRQVLLAFEAAERDRDPERRRRFLTFVVIGGGPTGVELAGALAELARFISARDFQNIQRSMVKVILLERTDRILASFSQDLSEKALLQLRRLGVDVRLGTSVTNIDAAGVHTSEGLIPTSTVIWGAGVCASTLTSSLGVETDRAGRIIVAPDLSIPSYPEVFAIGDNAAFLHQTGAPLPGVAPVAMQQGRAAAQNILNSIRGRERKEFRYVDKGNMATIGRSAAIVEIGKLKLSGFLAWIFWTLLHIFFLIGFRNRVVVSLNWLWLYFTYQRGARLITGDRFHSPLS